MPDPASPEIVRCLSAPVLRALLDAFGAPASPKNAAVDVARALFEESAPAKLARAAPLLARLGTRSGLRAIVEAARAVRDARADAWSATEPVDVVATLLVEGATAKGRARRAAKRLLDLALLRVERELPERATYELLAGRPLAHEDVVRALRKALGRALREAWHHVGADGALRVALFMAQGHVDLVRVSPDGARVAVTPAIPEQLSAYVHALGLSMRPSLTLKLLHDLDAAALARVALPPGVRSISVVALRWRFPNGARIEIRAEDALAIAQALGAAGAGYVDRATIRVETDDRAADAFLQLPHRVEIADRAREPVVRAAIAALGVFEPGARPDDARSLAPYEHPEWRWRGVVGDEGFARLVARGLLARVTVAHVATEDMRMHGASYVVRRVPGGGGEYALAEDRAYGARVVAPEDRVAWRLDRDALAGAMRADLGAAPAAAASAIAVDGVLDLGVVALASGKLRFAFAMAAPPRGWLASVRRACGIGVTPVVLVPRGHAAGIDGVAVVELDVPEQLGVAGAGRALGRAAEALGVPHEVERWRTCEEDMVIDAAAETVWIAGTAVALSDNAYRLLVLLARAGRVVATKALGARISASGYPDEVARRAKRQLEKDAGAALAARGVAWPVERLVVAEGKKGYRLGVAVRLVEAQGAS
jgi:hypothetical protein